MTAAPARRQAGQRGAVALEFALVFPLVVLLMLFMINAGLVLWARFATLAAAHAAASSCTKVVPADDAFIQGCAQAFPGTNANLYALSSLCLGGPATLATSIPAMASSGTSVVKGIAVDVACVVRTPGMPTFPWLGSFVWTTPTIHGFAAMPYVVQNLGAPPAPH